MPKIAELTVTEAQNGERLSMHVGDSITIELPESGAAGYRWSPSPSETAVIELESQTYRPTGGGIGSAGTSVWRWRATSTGTARLELKKSRLWETDARAAADVFAIDVDITA